MASVLKYISQEALWQDTQFVGRGIKLKDNALNKYYQAALLQQQ
jgi:hypothetical protein